MLESFFLLHEINTLNVKHFLFQNCSPGGTGAVLFNVHQMLHGTQASTFLHYSALYRFGGETFFNLHINVIHPLNQEHSGIHGFCLY